MAAEGGNNIVRYVYRGQVDEIIPREATHITVAEGVTFVRTRAFLRHPNIVEVICHENVEKIERYAFHGCPNLRRVVMPGVKILERWAFQNCSALTDVEYGKLEIIGYDAFFGCHTLRSIDLPSTSIVEMDAFSNCEALMDVKFGSKLEMIEGAAFYQCVSLERITIPLKDGLITDDDIFMECENLMYVDLVEGELHETIAALQLEDWRNDMNEEIDSINQILPNARAGYYDDEWDDYDPGDKAEAIRTWIRSVLGKIAHYRVEHERLLIEAAATLQLALPQDIAMNNILPFLELPSYTLEREE